MPLPYSLAGWQKTLWKDSIEFFRQDQRDRGDRGNLSGYRRVGEYDPHPCLFHATDNYDEPNSPAGQSKVNNLMTSDRASLHVLADVRAEDFAKVTTRLGKVSWYKVAGAPKERELTRYQRIYLTTSKKPKVNDGVWNG